MTAMANIYVRTPLGRVTAFNPAAELPAPLKILLKAVNGKTTTAALQAAHAGLGDVDSLLAILRDNGLIADKSAAIVPVTQAPEGSEAWAESDHPLLDSSFSDFGSSMFGQFPAPQSKKPQ